MRREKIEELKRLMDEVRPIKMVNIEQHNNTRFLKIKSTMYYYKDGTTATKEEILVRDKDGSYKTPKAVIVVPILVNGEIEVVVEAKENNREMVGIGFPAGYVDNNDLDISDSALRELREETGLYSDDIIYLDTYKTSDGISKEEISLFIAKRCDRRYNRELDRDERLNSMSFTYEELLELERQKLIAGVNTKYGLRLLPSYL